MDRYVLKWYFTRILKTVQFFSVEEKSYEM